jgi:hypothetical protein
MRLAAVNLARDHFDSMRMVEELECLYSRLIGPS